jgi:hypothetical protein
LPWDGSPTRHPDDDTPEAVFSGALVNLKNVATHKSVALTVEVPEEYAAALIAAFGWPTRVRPVAVAIAKLAGEVEPPARVQPKKEHWAEMAPSKQAAILCQEPGFRDFMADKSTFIRHGTLAVEEGVRAACRVSSRSEITPGSDAERLWRGLMIEYGAWLRARRGEA